MDSYAIWFVFLITHSGGNFGCPYCLKRYFKRSSETVSFWLRGQISPFDFKQRLPNMSFMVTLHEQVLLLMPITTTLKFFILCSRKFSTSSLKKYFAADCQSILNEILVEIGELEVWGESVG